MTPPLIAKIKKIDGRRWNPLDKYWTVPRTSGILDVLTKLFAPEPLVVDSALQLDMIGGNRAKKLNPAGHASQHFFYKSAFSKSI